MINIAATEPLTSAGDLVAALARSKVFRDYHAAFTELSGLDLELSCPDERTPNPRPRTLGNRFCELMASHRKACEECLQLQRRLDRESVHSAHTAHCFADMCETSIPVRAGSRVVAFLHARHVLLQRPNHRSFSKVARTLLDWRIKVDLTHAERLWKETVVLAPRVHQAFIRLLTLFADHLGMIAEKLGAAALRETGSPIDRAMSYVRDHASEDLKLVDVARTMNLSAHYFSRKFAEVAGMRFTEFVNRARVERACNLLRNPGVRVNEAAFDSGFRSLSQFNRIFRRLTGKSPRQFQSGTD